MKSVILFFLAVLNFLFAFSQQADDYRYGLGFNSHATNLDARTSLNLNPNRPFSKLDEGFSLSFELKLRKEVQTFGYIFRMVIDEKSSFDFLANLVENEFNFLINDRLGQLAASQRYKDNQNVVADKWIPIELRFFSSYIEINIGRKRIILKKGIESFKHLEFYFGANKTKYFHTTEVPPITLRNIKLVNEGKLARHWVLAKHRNSEVYDEVEKDMAKVENGIWEIDQHAEWKKVSTSFFTIPPQVAFDDKKGRIFMVDEDKIFIYNVVEGNIDTIKVVKGNPYWGISRQIVYDSKNDELLSYTVQSPVFYSFSFKTNSWSGTPKTYIDSRQHHNHFLDTATNTLNIMMGYAYHKYNTGQMKLGLDGNSKQWTSQSFQPNISPRYLSALGVLDKNHVLILGGYGSKSGKQEEFPHNFYDLYKIEPNTGKNVKLWELNIDTPYIVFSNSMHIDTPKNKLFVLGYNNFNYKSKAMLYGFDIQTDKPSWHTYGNALPFNFLDIESYCDLFYDKKSNRLYALMSHKVNKDKHEINIYSIAYPAFSFNEIHQKEPRYFLGYTLILVILGIGLGVACVGYFLILRAKRKKITGRSKVLEKSKVSDVNHASGLATAPCTMTISLFNGFQFLGKDNIDYSIQFTPIPKQIFLYLLLHTLQGKKGGVSSHELDQTFWQGMEQDKAINNRSVNIRKLRILLASLGNIEIAHKNGNWILNINEDFVCDYQIVMSLLRQIEADGLYTKIRVEEIIELSKGKLLPGIENEWIDSFKSNFTSLLIKVLLIAIKEEEIKAETNLRLKIVEVILIHDSLEENAIIYKCNLLYKTGQKGQSKHIFDKYCTEYQQMLNASPNLVYSDIILLDL